MYNVFKPAQDVQVVVSVQVAAVFGVVPAVAQELGVGGGGGPGPVEVVRDHILTWGTSAMHRDLKFSIHIGSDSPTNGTNLGLLKIIFSTFWLSEPKYTENEYINFYQID